MQKKLRGWLNFIKGYIAYFRTFVLQECGSLLKKHFVFKIDCNLQAAFSFNNILFLFQGMLQCSLATALFDRLEKVIFPHKYQWIWSFGRFEGGWAYIYIILDAIKAIYQKPMFQVMHRDKFSSWLSQRTGIRQGCPLSPYLFIVTMHVLFHDVHRRFNDPRTHATQKLSKELISTNCCTQMTH